MLFYTVLFFWHFVLGQTLLTFRPLLCTDLEEEEEYAEDQQLPTSNLPGRQQQGSVKSNQSHTSVEDNIPYDEDQEEDEEEEDREETPAKKRTISANRVSFRDESEIREIVSRATVDIS